MVRTIFLFLFGIFLQQIFIIIAEPDVYSDCSAPCPTPYAVPGLQLLPIPQPVPFKLPQKKQQQQQSVTIPNIILALLPPTPKSKPNSPSCAAPRSAIPPQPIMLPIPQPYPVPFCETGCSSYY